MKQASKVRTPQAMRCAATGSAARRRTPLMQPSGSLQVSPLTAWQCSRGGAPPQRLPPATGVRPRSWLPAPGRRSPSSRWPPLRGPPRWPGTPGRPAEVVGMRGGGWRGSGPARSQRRASPHRARPAGRGQCWAPAAAPAAGFERAAAPAAPPSPRTCRVLTRVKVSRVGRVCRVSRPTTFVLRGAGRRGRGW